MYYWATPGSAWVQYEISGNDTAFMAPAIAVRSGGEADVVTIGASGSLWYYDATPGSGWDSTDP
jgi:hypothetical protein